MEKNNPISNGALYQFRREIELKTLKADCLFTQTELTQLGAVLNLPSSHVTLVDNSHEEIKLIFPKGFNQYRICTELGLKDHIAVLSGTRTVWKIKSIEFYPNIRYRVVILKYEGTM